MTNSSSRSKVLLLGFLVVCAALCGGAWYLAAAPAPAPEAVTQDVPLPGNANGLGVGVALPTIGQSGQGSQSNAPAGGAVAPSAAQAPSKLPAAEGLPALPPAPAR
ncbi:hypothetical protein E3E12_06365 [Formicincola oecophyllae]|uniref:Uncharacterized protein n=1 Tax=Formicincola oecophyllae TaxID=2558361 RepID=A0A4Y6U917_9PROT|nr:hypothetical protein [Formicincola oecophyllae]QDH13872.1 hypothetical protein E3E12_06365 [Formicincola oecophyllae]